MSKADWETRQRNYLLAHAKTGIKPAEWCAAHGYNYDSARRYIKTPKGEKKTIKSAQKTLKKTAQTAQKKTPKSAQSKPAQIAQNAQFSDLAPTSAAPDFDLNALDLDLPKLGVDFSLNQQQAFFVLEYLRTRNKFTAYRRAGYKCEGATGEAAARRLYRNVSVNRAINFAVKAQHDRLRLNADEVLKEWIDIATADPNELTEFRRVNCRFCWGKYHFYQWSDFDEFNAAQKAARSAKSAPINDGGGYGFIENDDPNPDCPKCNGEGFGVAFFHDTRDLTGPARRLYAGVKQTKNGLEILMHDQAAALKIVSQCLGLLVDKFDHTSSDGSMTPTNTPEQRRARIAELLQRRTNAKPTN